MHRLSKLMDRTMLRPSGNLEPSISHLVDSNLPPTEEEEIAIRQALAEAQNLEDDLESKLQSLEIPTSSTSRSQDARFHKTIDQLQEAHEGALAYTRMLSAYRRLPVEVVMIIFTLCNDPFTFDSWYRRPCLSSFRISHVCRAWRTIALSMPELWTSLNLRVDDYTAVTGNHLVSSLKAKVKGRVKPKSTPYCDFVAELLRRTQDRELHVFVYARYYRYASMDEHPVLSLLAPQLWRCSSLILDTMVATLHTIFYSFGWRLSPIKVWRKDGDLMPQKRTSCLRALKIDLFDWDERNPQSIFIPQDFPLLNHVELFGVREEYVRHSLPLAQLHTFRQSSGSSSLATPSFRTLIPAVPNLKTLKLGFQNYDDIEWLVPPVTSSSQIVAPEVTALDLFIAPDDSPMLACIFTHFNLSSLLELRVGSYPGTLLQEIIRNATCLRPINYLPLTKLCLRTGKPEPEAIEKFLEIAPYLEELDIELSLLQDNLECLVAKRLVPRLSALTFYTSKAEDIRGQESALSVIGATRFSSRQKDSAPTLPVYPRRASSYKIILSSLDEASNALTLLNMWHFKSTESQPFLRIAEWRLELAPLVDIIAEGEIPKDDRARIARELHSLMLEIESFRLKSGQDIANLFQSKILDPLLSLCRAKDTYFVLYYGRKYSFSGWTEKLLQTWKMDVCRHFLAMGGNAPFMFDNCRVLAYHGPSSECLIERPIDQFFGTKDDSYHLDWQKHMYWG